MKPGKSGHSQVGPWPASALEYILVMKLHKTAKK